MNVPREQIREVLYQYGDTTFALTFQDSVWLVGDDPADDGRVVNLISSLAEVRADDFLDARLFLHPFGDGAALGARAQDHDLPHY